TFVRLRAGPWFASGGRHDRTLRPAHAGPAIADRRNGPGVDERPLECLARGAAEPAMEVRDPLEGAFVVASPQSVEQERVWMQPGMPLAPLVEIGGPAGAASRSAQPALLSLVPPLRRGVGE